MPRNNSRVVVAGEAYLDYLEKMCPTKFWHVSHIKINVEYL